MLLSIIRSILFIDYFACLVSQQVHTSRRPLFSSPLQRWICVGNGDGARFGFGRILCAAENAHPPAVFFSGRPSVVRCGDDVLRRRALTRSRAVYGPGPGPGCLGCLPLSSSCGQTRATELWTSRQPTTNNVGTELRCAMCGAAWGQMRTTPGGFGGLRMIPYRGINERLLRLASRLGMQQKSEPDECTSIDMLKPGSWPLHLG